jgi:hypothetical protein
MNLVYRIFVFVCATSLWFTLQSYQSGAAANGTGGESGDNTGTTTLALTEQAPVCTSAILTTERLRK